MVVLGREVVDGGGGFALGGGMVAGVGVNVRNLIGGNEFLADVVAVALIIFRDAAAKEGVGVGIGAMSHWRAHS